MRKAAARSGRSRYERRARYRLVRGELGLLADDRRAEGGLRRGDGPIAPPRGDPPAFARRAPALDRIAEAFGLSSLSAIPAASVRRRGARSGIRALCARRAKRRREAFPELRWRSPTCPMRTGPRSARGALRRWRLIEMAVGQPLTTAPLRIDETVLHFLAGLPSSDRVSRRCCCRCRCSASMR